jgi:hypothetical protein
LNLAILNKILLEKLHKKAFQFVLVAIVYLKKVLSMNLESLGARNSPIPGDIISGETAGTRYGPQCVGILGCQGIGYFRN